MGHACPALCPAESGGVRPFGVSLLMAGYDDHGPQLYQIDPSGSYFAWKASGAVGDVWRGGAVGRWGCGAVGPWQQREGLVLLLLC